MAAIVDAAPTGEIQIVGSGTPKTDLIVQELAGNVWQLLCAGELRAALVLMRSRAVEFEMAWREEFVGVPAVPEPPAAPPSENCTSMAHSRLSCARALAEGVLSEDEPFCKHCTQEQLKLTQAPQIEEPPTDEAETGRIVHVVTPVGTAPMRAAS